MKTPSGFAPIIIVAIIALITAFGAFYVYQKHSIAIQQTHDEVIINSPSPASISDETANWKTYTNENGKYSIKYPPNWKALKDVNNINSGRLEPLDTEYIKTFWDDKEIKNLKVGIYMAVNEGSSACETNKEKINIGGLAGHKGKEQQGDGNIYAICGTVNRNGATHVITLEDKDFSREKLFNQILATFKFL